MKVMFFDSWTAAASNHFVPIAKRLKQKGIESLLVHVGSWGSDIGRPLKEEIEGMCVRDIAAYGTRYIYDVLRVENPYAVVILTTNYFKDRAVFIACRALSIKSIFLMHGIEELDSKNIKITIQNRKINLRRKRWEVASKWFKYIIPNYIYSGIRNRWNFLFGAEPWRAMWGILRNPELRLTYPHPSEELVADLALVYSDAYGEFYKKIYGYSDNNIRVVGIPFLNDAVAQDSIESEDIRQRYSVSNEREIAVYIEDANVESNVKGWTTDSRLEYLYEISELCRINNVFFVIKLHPGNTDKELLTERLTSRGITIVIDRYPLYELIKQADYVIGHISTVLMFAVYCYKPILIPQWGIGEFIPDRFSGHGVGVPLKGKEELTEIFRKRSINGTSFETNRNIFEMYMKKYIGPVDGKCIDRIVKYIIS